MRWAKFGARLKANVLPLLVLVAIGVLLLLVWRANVVIDELRDLRLTTELIVRQQHQISFDQTSLGHATERRTEDLTRAIDKKRFGEDKRFSENTATIDLITQDSIDIARIEDGVHRGYRYTLDPNVAVIIEGKPGKVSDLKRGDHVTVASRSGKVGLIERWPEMELQAKP